MTCIKRGDLYSCCSNPEPLFTGRLLVPLNHLSERPKGFISALYKLLVTNLFWPVSRAHLLLKSKYRWRWWYGKIVNIFVLLGNLLYFDRLFGIYTNHMNLKIIQINKKRIFDSS